MNATREKILKIITAATMAPSGDNSQPWRFVVHENAIEFHYLPERDNPILNYEEGGTLIALGAAIQNAELEACAQGFTPRIEYRERGSCVAVLELSEGGVPDASGTSLREAITRRHSNRKAYKKIPLAYESRAKILDSRISGGKGLKLSVVESREAMEEVARALTTMEETALANHTLHGMFFGDIFWSDIDNRMGKSGLHIKTLELPPPAQAMFRVLKHWSFARLLAKVGFPRMVAKTNAAQNASASAFGIITVAVTSRESYLEIGKTLERIWLSAVSQGLSLQVVTGITFLARAIDVPGVARFFSDAERMRARYAYATIKKYVEEKYEPILVFRIGESDAPTEVSYRRAPDVTFT